MSNQTTKSEKSNKKNKAEHADSSKDNHSEESNGSGKVAKIIRIASIVLVLGGLVALMIYNSPSNLAAEPIWDERFTVGNVKAKNHYVMYTDLMCPYCNVFSREIMNHEEEFQRDYIEGKDIVYEIRLTDFLYEYGNASAYSLNAAEGAYCAAEENRFWDYYHGALKALWKDYNSKGIGVSKTSPAITNLPENYWLKVGQKAGIAGNFENCMKNHEQRDKVHQVTERAAKTVDGGVPHFKFNKFNNGGFDSNWGWDYVKKYLDAGLSSKT